MKKILALTLALAMTASLTACGGTAGSTESAAVSGEKETAAAEAVAEEPAADSNVLAEADNGYVADHVTVGVATIDSLNPLEKNVFHGMYEVYECLYGFDGVGGEMYAVLADDARGEFGGYDHEEGSSDYTVYICDNIYDHAGNHITGSDVAFSYNYRNENAANSWPAFESVEAVDDTSVIFHFNRELTGVGDLATYFYDVFIVSEQAFNDSGSKLLNDMCGTGPYKFVSYVDGSNLELVKNEDYWQTDDAKRKSWANANVEAITYDIIAEASQQIIALQSGEVDIVDGIKPAYVDQLTADGSYQAYNYNSNMIMCALPNCSSTSICSNESFRKAVFYAIDNDAVATAYNGEVEVAHTFAIKGFSDYDEAWNIGDDYTTKVSQELVDQYLEEAGYNGEEVTLMVMGMDMFSLAGQVVQNQLTEAGINCSMVTYDGATFMSLLADETEWDIALNCANSYDYNATFWNQMFTTARTTDGRTANFVEDAEWSALLDELMLEKGHTMENMTAWWNQAAEHAYFMPLISWMSYAIYPANVETFAMAYGNIILPGALIYKEN